MKNNLIIILFVVGVFIGCEKKGIDGKNSLMDLTIEPVGENCSSGGYKIVSGLDTNNNGILEENEIQNTEFICNGNNGNNGTNSLLNIIPETIGENCSSGGYKVISGLDLNNNYSLDENEILNTKYICNGENGINGITSLINVTPEPSGEFCDYGGIRIESGLDQNNNGILDNDEIIAINYICNGEDGQSSGEVSTIRLPFNLAYKWSSPENYWTSEVQDGLIYGFDKLDYNGFDSIGFIAQFHRGETSDRIWLRLYDYTASQGISNSELFSAIPDSQLDDPHKRTLKSRNFANSILAGPRTIGIQFRKEVSDYRSISIHHAEIILHRNE